MITSHLMGGLGNQLFQISAALSLAYDNQDHCVFNPKNTSCMFHRDVSCYLDNIFRNLNFDDSVGFEKVFHEQTFYFSEIPYHQNMCLRGYFQSEKYFCNHKDKIREVFSMDENTKKLISHKYGSLLKNNVVTSIHIRRNDYIRLQNVHPLCTNEYYEKAINEMPKGGLIFIFSDDIEYAKSAFKSKQFKIIEENDIISLYLMSLCHNNIIANSSFSWWGAWLNSNSNKRVLAPKKWFGSSVSYNTKDLYCPEWKII